MTKRSKAKHQQPISAQRAAALCKLALALSERGVVEQHPLFSRVFEADDMIVHYLDASPQGGSRFLLVKQKERTPKGPVVKMPFCVRWETGSPSKLNVINYEPGEWEEWLRWLHDEDFIEMYETLKWSERDRPFDMAARAHERGEGWLWSTGTAGDHVRYLIRPTNGGGRSRRVIGYRLFLEALMETEPVTERTFKTVDQAKAAAAADFVKRRPKLIARLEKRGMKVVADTGPRK